MDFVQCILNLQQKSWRITGWNVFYSPEGMYSHWNTSIFREELEQK
jgi:hypothetical protein